SRTRFRMIARREAHAGGRGKDAGSAHSKRDMGATFSWSPEGRSPRDLQRRISTWPLSSKRVLRRAVVEPPARDVLAPHEPDARELERVLEEVAHGRRTRSLTAPARVCTATVIRLGRS